MDKILFVFEGEKTENQIFESVFRAYTFTNNHIIKVAYCTTIYDLYARLKKDPDLDIVELLRDKVVHGVKINAASLLGIKRTDFSMTYLFFDYDGHAPIADDNKIKDMLELFDEETNNGKLYISYPMVEAYQNFTNKDNFDCKVMCTIEAKKNIEFKKIVAKNSVFKKLSQINNEHWDFIIRNYIKKSYCIVSQLPQPNKKQLG